MTSIPLILVLISHNGVEAQSRDIATMLWTTNNIHRDLSLFGTTPTELTTTSLGGRVAFWGADEQGIDWFFGIGVHEITSVWLHKSNWHGSQIEFSPRSEAASYESDWDAVLDSITKKYASQDELHWQRARRWISRDGIEHPAIEQTVRRGEWPVFSAGARMRVAWDEEGRIVHGYVSLRLPLRPVHDLPPRTIEQMSIRLQDELTKEANLRGFARRLDVKHVTLGWSVENNAGDCRLVYFYDDMAQYGQGGIPFAIDAATGERVANP
jgi:hypothetical protein